jgi:hypothetical protein
MTDHVKSKENLILEFSPHVFLKQRGLVGNKQFRRPGSSARLSEVEFFTKSILMVGRERILIVLKNRDSQMP